MGILGRFEKKVEGAVNGVFARAFKGDVQPVEIAARLQRELDGEAKLMSRDKRLVPNEFEVGLSQHDYDKLAPYSKTLTAEFAGELRDSCARDRLRFQRPDQDHSAAGQQAADWPIHGCLGGGGRRPDGPAARTSTYFRREWRPARARSQRHPTPAAAARPDHWSRHGGRPADQRSQHLPTAR